MTVKATLVFGMTAVETLSASLVPSVANRAITHQAFNVKHTVAGNTTPAVSFLSCQTLAAASGTIDFAALPTAGGVASAVGLKLKALRIHNRGANPLVLSAGASNGYALPGGVSITVPPGGAVQWWVGDSLATSASGNRTLDYMFHADDQADLTLLLGPPPA